MNIRWEELEEKYKENWLFVYMLWTGNVVVVVDV